MLKFDIQVNLQTDVLAEPASKAEHIVALQVAKDTEKYVPALTGTMSNQTQVVENVITYKGPQASMLYRGKLMVDPETGSAWAKKGATKVLTNRDLVFTKTVHPMAQSHWAEVSKAENMDEWERVAGKAMKRELDR